MPVMLLIGLLCSVTGGPASRPKLERGAPGLRVAWYRDVKIIAENDWLLIHTILVVSQSARSPCKC
uniref:Uncharacterized protein n=1 Tax=Gasterosteus aculeatus aculeatus TaxID=481459 RepID=A0AAQ4PTD3_GASAC